MATLNKYDSNKCCVKTFLDMYDTRIELIMAVTGKAVYYQKFYQYLLL